MSAVDAAQLTIGVKSSADFVLPGNLKSRVGALIGWEQVAGTTPAATHACRGHIVHRAGRLAPMAARWPSAASSTWR